MTVLVGLGERLAERFLPIYILAIGGGTLAIGLLQALENLLGALYAFPGGWLAQRFGARRTLLAVNLLAAGGYVLVILVPRWEGVLAGAALFVAWNAVSLPATLGLIARLLPPERRTTGVGLYALVRRVPMALGPLLGGGLIAWAGETEGVRLGFAAALALTLVGAALQWRWVPDTKAIGAEALPLGLAGTFRLMTRPLRTLLLSDILIRFCEQIPYAFVVVWCLKTIAQPVSAPEFGVLTAIEMATAMLIYLPAAHFADRWGKTPFVVVTFAFFTAFPLALLAAQSFLALLPVFMLRGLKEFGEPARKALILDLAPAGHKPAVFGLYYLIRDLFVSVAAFGGAGLWLVSPAVNLVSASLCGLAGLLILLLANRRSAG
ncbi:MAG: MFS transporter [Rhodospirillales bacterium]|nr:MFS transporter [Rhodospirillales bacterium]